MLFSIIIPAYNSAAFIHHCLDSIIAQDFPKEEYEILVIDDSSTDNTIGVIEHYTSKLNRIYDQATNSLGYNIHLLKHNSNKKQGGARNTGIFAAKGKWICFIDSDDYWISNNVLSSFSSLIEKYKECNSIRSVNFLKTSSRLNRNNKLSAKIIEQKRGEAIYSMPGFSYTVWSGIYKRESLLDNNIFFEENMFFEDVAWCTKLMSKIGEVLLIDFPFYGYYNNIQSTTRTHSFSAFRDNARSTLEVLKIIESSDDRKFISTGYGRIIGTLISLPRQARYFPLKESYAIIKPLIKIQNLYRDLTCLTRKRRWKLFLLRNFPSITLLYYHVPYIIKTRLFHK